MRCQTFAAFLLATALPAIGAAINADTQGSGHDSRLIARQDDAAQTDFYDPEHRRQLIARGLSDVEPFPPQQVQARSDEEEADLAGAGDDVELLDDDADFHDDAEFDDDAGFDDDAALDEDAEFDDDDAEFDDDASVFDDAGAEFDDDASAPAPYDEFAEFDEDHADEADADDDLARRDRVEDVEVNSEEDDASDILRRGVTGQPAFVQPVARRHPRQFRSFA